MQSCRTRCAYAQVASLTLLLLPHGGKVVYASAAPATAFRSLCAGYLRFTRMRNATATATATGTRPRLPLRHRLPRLLLLLLLTRAPLAGVNGFVLFPDNNNNNTARQN